MRNSNPILATWNTVKEDHLTEFLAVALTADPDFARAYVSVLLDGDGAEIADVDTQVGEFDGNRPDLKITLTDGRTLVCEHKLWATETVNENEDGEIVKQVRRYLDLPSDGVAYIRAEMKDMEPEVLNHRRYLRPPSSAQHFRWMHFREALDAGDHLITNWLKEVFDRMGFTPPVPLIGELVGDSNEVIANKKNFGKFWDPMFSDFAAMGWKTSQANYCGIDLHSNDRAACDRVQMSPLAAGGHVFRVRLTPRCLDDVPDLLRRAKSAALDPAARVLTSKPKRVRERAEVVDVDVSLTNLFGRHESTDAISEALRDFIMPIVRATMVEAGE